MLHLMSRVPSQDACRYVLRLGGTAGLAHATPGPASTSAAAPSIGATPATPSVPPAGPSESPTKLGTLRIFIAPEAGSLSIVSSFKLGVLSTGVPFAQREDAERAALAWP